MKKSMLIKIAVVVVFFAVIILGAKTKTEETPTIAYDTQVDYRVMIEGFEEIYVVDGREYKNSVMDTIEQFGITDVLFAECTFSAVGRYLTFLEELCR